ncbi:MAG: LON peptidase substrate-binding domain-containing protein [Anaerolineaceae bacterium]|nr:LON peptidase substrate-binding domain-containing protein [Anaerolineaceae bacterium]
MFELPLFPLHTVLFPGMPLHLHIFESRYQLMIQQCMEKNQGFGVVLIRSGQDTGNQNVKFYPIGCSARITAIEPLKDGHLNLVARGEQRFRILKVSDTQPFLLGQVEAIPIESSPGLMNKYNIDAFSQLVRKYLHVFSKISTDETDLSLLQLPDEPTLLLYLAASIIQLPSYEKQPLLEAKSLEQFFDRLERIYQREKAVLLHLLPISNNNARRSAAVN